MKKSQFQANCLPTPPHPTSSRQSPALTAKESRIEIHKSSKIWRLVWHSHTAHKGKTKKAPPDLPGKPDPKCLPWRSPPKNWRAVSFRGGFEFVLTVNRLCSLSLPFSDSIQEKTRKPYRCDQTAESVVVYFFIHLRCFTFFQFFSTTATHFVANFLLIDDEGKGF